ncbi:MAG: hypothetical protein V5B36_00960 [Candidatus Accumulibacter sp. UW25]|jgi:hypothetical protein
MATITKYSLGLKNQYNGVAVVDYDTDTIKVALVTSSYTPSQAHDFFNDVTNEVTGTNYPAGGITLTSKTLTESSGTITFDADDVTCATGGTTFNNARIAVLYKSTGVSSTSPLIGYIDFGSDKGNAASDLILQWHASGIFTVS